MMNALGKALLFTFWLLSQAIGFALPARPSVAEPQLATCPAFEQRQAADAKILYDGRPLSCLGYDAELPPATTQAVSDPVGLLTSTLAYDQGMSWLQRTIATIMIDGDEENFQRNLRQYNPALYHQVYPRNALTEPSTRDILMLGVLLHTGKGTINAFRAPPPITTTTLPNPYAGIQDASTFLRAQGVSRADRVQILQSFNPQNMTVRQAGSSEFGLRFFSDASRPGGSYLFETFPASRGSLAIKPEWSTMSGFRACT